ncbi:ATP phosphoribosyltransferase [Candidatus Nasuia deltocephalinicola]|uniref:ATP phosphoribosyltransferase n=1 Tax=Candidatus Nasuia deltocephalincola TaxID=1160784 RepID=A0A975A3Q5_9PROT|nr:ATP phosphoribosyltransferase [Candidatus Nasuia deltocephalinicola]
MKFIIYISKGRNFKEIELFLKNKKLKIYKKNKRKLYLKTNKKNIIIIIIKNIDFKNYLKNNLIDLMFIGLDVIINKSINLFLNYKFLKINLFNLSIISNNNYKFFNYKKLNFWTKYKKILKNYLEYKNILKFSKIKNINGSIENMCIFNKNLILDIISSGNTIKSNKLFKLKNIINLKNIIIYNNNIIFNKIFKFMENRYVKN